MQVVIEISEEAYNLVKNEGVDWLGAEHILSAVANGTPLSKGHGRLGDLSKIYVELNKAQVKDQKNTKDWEKPNK